MNRLLIVEDEANLGQTLRDYWRGKGHQVEWAASVKEAEKAFQNAVGAFDVVLMDINLPDGNGLDLARRWRGLRKDLVLVFLSAMNDPAMRVEGLEIGAEDYVTKPFELKELTLRLERIFSYRQRTAGEPEEMRFGKLIFWPRRFEVQDAQGIIHQWGQKEAAIFQLLFDRRSEVLSRDEIIEEVWGEESFPTNRTVDNYIVKIRKWVESDSNFPIRLTSVRGVGYKLEGSGP